MLIKIRHNKALVRTQTPLRFVCAAQLSNYRVRVEPELHQQFLDACRANDRPAAQVLREFMKEYVEQQKRTAQIDLFEGCGSNE